MKLNSIIWPMKTGGVIINHKYVMTTAQCVRDINNSTIDSLYIRIGVHNLKDIIVPEKYAKVYRVLVDTRYSRGQRSNEVGDFALLELDRSLQFDNFIQPGLYILHWLSDSFFKS